MLRNATFAAAGLFAIGLMVGNSAEPKAPAKKGDTRSSQKVAALSVEAEAYRKQLSEAVAALGKVTDYTCTVVKQERILGKLQPEQTMQMSVCEKPFSVFLKFTAPAALAGQEVCYVTGKHNNQMRVKGNGLKASLGFVSLALNDARVMSQSRHTVAEAGLGNLLQTLTKAAENIDQFQFETSKTELHERKCIRFDIHLPEQSETGFHRCAVVFDEESKLVVGFEAYDKPKEEGSRGELLESYSFMHLKLNVGLPDETFKK